MKAALLLLLILLAPVAAASTYTVRLDVAEGAWNGETRLDEPRGLVDLWVPAAARLHGVVAVTPQGNLTPSWRAQGNDRLRVETPANATALVATYDFRASSLLLADVALPAGPDARAVEVVAPEGMAVASDEAAFARGDDGAWRASVATPGDATVRVRVVDADRIGELPLVLSVAIVAAACFGLAWLWHRVRPPLDGRRPEKFLEHLAELQARLLPVAVLFAFLNFAYFASGLREVHWRNLTLVAPTFSVDSSLATRAFEAFAERLVPAGVQLVVLRPADAVLAQVQMTLFLAFVSILPLLLYELAVFVGPALRERERKLAVRVVPLVSGLFVAGALFGYLVMAPLMIRTLYDFAPATGAAPLLVVGDLISFSLLVIVAFGLAFELPVVMYVLARIGLVKAATFRHYLRHAVVVIVVTAGVVTPDPSVVSQLLVAVPVTTLYVLGMLAASLAERRRTKAKAGAAVA